MDFLSGQILLVDKPLDWTSFDVVNKIRNTIKKKLDIRKIKVGHAGTLDPKATGLLIIMTGKFTKRIEEVQNLSKVYTGVVKVGASRPSFDLETEIDADFPVEHINDDLIRKIIQSQFKGEIQQLPPMFSAVKIGGRRLYESARRGIQVERAPRTVQIKQFDFEFDGVDEISFEIECSKGTYIRSIAHDLGQALESGAYLQSLRRTAIGEYHIAKAKSIDEWIHIINSDAIEPSR
ncbi:MAG: tRNA pseudouridine(55) synthase TruB [Bacteroidia bacterium]|nr:tRNA pseudouridine(55) synthase TruB [Bacteroidia bacterium]